MSVEDPKIAEKDAAHHELAEWQAPTWHRIDASVAEGGFNPGLDGGLDS